MKIIIHTHALQRMKERGASEEEIHETVMNGERFPAKLEEQVLEKIYPLMAHGLEKNIQ